MTKKWQHISGYWKKNAAGFTLIELVIVLGIIAILSGASLATTRSIQRRTLSNASLALQADLRRVQRMAIIEGRRWRVQFYQEYNSYSIHSVPRPQADNIYRVQLPQGVELYFVSRSYFDFLPRGTVRQGFTIQLRSGNYLQEMTATVSAGRIAIREIERLR